MLESIFLPSFSLPLSLSTQLSTFLSQSMVFQSQGPVSFTKTTLSYPVYAAEFDPYNRGFLVVGGGGGQGRSGVANKIVRNLLPY
jgi:hypothetical protein